MFLPELLNQSSLLCTCQCPVEIANTTPLHKFWTMVIMIEAYSVFTNALSAIIRHIFIFFSVSTLPYQVYEGFQLPFYGSWFRHYFFLGVAHFRHDVILLLH